MIESRDIFFEFSGFSWFGVGAFLVKIRPILLQFFVICYFELPRQCPSGNKKGLRFSPKALIYLELEMGLEPATG